MIKSKPQIAFAGTLACLLGLHQVQAESWLVLDIEGHRLNVEVAETLAERRQGLMERTHLPADQGMLFVFEDDLKRCLWMKNTPLPLSAAFLDAQGYIINILALHPHDESPRCSAAPARFALEVPQGWFEAHGVVPELQVRGLPAAKN